MLEQQQGLLLLAAVVAPVLLIVAPAGDDGAGLLLLTDAGLRLGHRIADRWHHFKHVVQDIAAGWFHLTGLWRSGAVI